MLFEAHIHFQGQDYLLVTEKDRHVEHAALRIYKQGALLSYASGWVRGGVVDIDDPLKGEPLPVGLEWAATKALARRTPYLDDGALHTLKLIKEYKTATLRELATLVDRPHSRLKRDLRLLLAAGKIRLQPRQEQDPTTTARYGEAT